ncbi:MAG: exopolyphosphatase [Rhodospirillaceae bacterium]
MTDSPDDLLNSGEKFRLVTRSDFDGLVCAAVLKELNLIDEIKFVHPKDMQDGVIEITNKDITTNLPYVDGVKIAFDHHESETVRVGEKINHIILPEAPSAARVVYDWFDGKKTTPRITEDLMVAVDKGDSADFNKDEVINPKGWNLMNFLMDARTGLGRFREFTISNYQLMMELIDKCVEMPIEDILNLPDVQERADLYVEHESKAKEQIERCATVHKNVVVLDLRDEETIWAANRFLIYAMYPDTNISIHVMWGLKKQNTVFAVGKSIFDRSSKTNVGELMLARGGGGHHAVGTCQVPNDQSESLLRGLIERMNVDG